jgi:hypothetical protein
LGDGFIVTAQFQTVAERSSIMLAASGALLISTVAFAKSCRGGVYSPACLEQAEPAGRAISHENEPAPQGD